SQAASRSGIAGGGDLVARQGAARLEEPSAGSLLPTVPAQPVQCDEVRRRAAAVAAEEMPADLDPLDVRDRLLPHWDHEALLRDAPVDQEVRARANSRRVDSEIPEYGRRGHINVRLQTGYLV